MIQFNLIPSIKKDFLRAQRINRIVTLFVSLISGALLVLSVFLIVYVTFIQSNNLKNIDNTVQSRSVILEGNTNLDKILTVQNQLISLPNIQSQLPVVSRLFTFINQLTPISATISSFNTDFGQSTFTITGSADSLQTVNKFIDTLKFTNYKTSGSSSNNGLAFSGVVLSSFSYSTAASSSGNSANYTIDLSFNPSIFSNSSNVVLQVPNLVTTRSILDQPSNKIFAQQASSKN